MGCVSATEWRKVVATGASQAPWSGQVDTSKMWVRTRREADGGQFAMWNRCPIESIVLVLSRAATVLVLVNEREQRYWKMKSSIIIELTISAWGSLTRRWCVGIAGGV